MPPTPSPDSTMDRSVEKRAWRVLFFVTLLNSAQAALSVVGLPLYAQNAGLAPSQLSALLAALPIAAGISAFFAGTISDLLGRKLTLLFGLATLSLSLGLHGTATSFEAVLALRSLAGFATGALMGLPATLLTDAVHASRQQSAIGKTSCGYAVGQTIGIPAGIAVMDWTGYLWLNSILGILAAIAVPLCARLLPGRVTTSPKAPPKARRYFREAGATLANQRFRLLALSSFLSFTALSLFYVVFALWLFQVAQLRPTSIAPMYFGAGLLQIGVLALLLPRLRTRSLRSIIAASFLLNGLLFALAPLAFDRVATAALLFALTLGIVALRIPPLQFVINNQGLAQHKGLRSSLVQTSNHLGKATGAVIGSALFPIASGSSLTLLSGLIVLICSAFFLTPLVVSQATNQASDPAHRASPADERRPLPTS